MYRRSHRDWHRCVPLGTWWLDEPKRAHHALLSQCGTSEDLNIFGLTRGSCDGQQVLESLAILVALRIWEEQLNAKRVALVVRGGNVGALRLLVKMHPSSPQQAVVARELLH